MDRFGVELSFMVRVEVDFIFFLHVRNTVCNKLSAKVCLQNIFEMQIQRKMSGIARWRSLTSNFQTK